MDDKNSATRFFFSALWLKCLPIHLPVWDFPFLLAFLLYPFHVCPISFFFCHIPAAAYYFFFSPCKISSLLLCCMDCTACDCHLPSFCALISTFFLFIHSCLTVLCVCAVHVAEDLLACKQMQSDSSWRGRPSWASKPRASPVSTCAECPSSLLFVIFLPLIYPSSTACCRNLVTPNMCRNFSERDRKVRELVVVRDMSAQVKRCSSLHHHHHHYQPLLLIPASVLVRKPLSLISPKLEFTFCSCCWTTEPAALRMKTAGSPSVITVVTTP